MSRELRQELWLDFEIFPSLLDFKRKKFKRQKLSNVFFIEYKPGYFASRDILFKANRNSEDKNDKDLLTSYLNENYLDELKIALLQKNIINENFDIKNLKWFLPSKQDEIDFPLIFDIKKYENKEMWYWLEDKKSAALFASVDSGGYATNIYASAVGGCAPCFCVSGISLSGPLVGPLAEVNKLFNDWKW